MLAQLENLLRQDAAQLTSDAAERFEEQFEADAPLSLPLSNFAQAGSQYIHDLVLIAVALYPSENSVRQSLAWTTSGALRDRGVTFEHHVAMLNGYFEAAYARLPAEYQANLREIKTMLMRVLRDVFGM